MSAPTETAVPETGVLALRCPKCMGTVSWASGECTQCTESFLDAHGYPNFVHRADSAAERAFYDAHYQAIGGSAANSKRTIEHAATLWGNPWNSHERVIWDRMSAITQKRVLLLGNGESEKELAFLTFKPASLVYSDLSSTAVKLMFHRYDLAPLGDRIRGAAIDALALPCHDNSVDVVYGFAMVHHLPDVPLFLAEVHRVLAPGGYCVFFDDAYAPLWHNAKMTVLKPLMQWSHKTSGIYLEDLRFTMSGGFRPEELSRTIHSLGGEPWFERTGFLTYLWTRAVEKIAPARLRPMLAPRWLGRVISSLDRLLAPLLRNNGIRLTWGFRKPA